MEAMILVNVDGKIVLDTDVIELLLANRDKCKELDFEIDWEDMDCAPNSSALQDEDLKGDIEYEFKRWLSHNYCLFYGDQNDDDSFSTDIKGPKISFFGDDLYWGDGWFPIDKCEDTLDTMVSLFGDHIKEYNVTIVGRNDCFRHILKNGKVVIEDGSIQAVFPD